MFDSDPEVIKLLVSPLYGGKPSYGVRELIQNAVDACRELKYLYKVRAELGQYTPEIKVGIYQLDSNYYFQIEDNGIGMSAEVIVHYFLKSLKQTNWLKFGLNLHKNFPIIYGFI